MRPLLDEHLSQRIAGALRAKAYDVVSVHEVGLEGQPDRVIWERAIDEGRVLVTYDVSDFPDLFDVLFFEGIHHPGLVVVSAKTIAQEDIGVITRSLEHLVRTDEDLADQCVFLQR